MLLGEFSAKKDKIHSSYFIFVPLQFTFNSEGPEFFS